MVILKTVNSNSGIKMKNTYGDESYLKFPEYGILHYIKKIFGETELKDFTDFAFDSTGNYWKVNEKGDLIDDGNIIDVNKLAPLNAYGDIFCVPVIVTVLMLFIIPFQTTSCCEFQVSIIPPIISND